MNLKFWVEWTLIWGFDCVANLSLFQLLMDTVWFWLMTPLAAMAGYTFIRAASELIDDSFPTDAPWLMGALLVNSCLTLVSNTASPPFLPSGIILYIITTFVGETSQRGMNRQKRPTIDHLNSTKNNSRWPTTVGLWLRSEDISLPGTTGGGLQTALLRFNFLRESIPSLKTR